jgi:hypothetical protein
MANSRTLAKHRVHHPARERAEAPCLHPAKTYLAKRYFDCQKTKRAGFELPREATRSIQFSRFFLEIWEREAAPAELLLSEPAIDERCTHTTRGANLLPFGVVFCVHHLDHQLN